MDVVFEKAYAISGDLKKIRRIFNYGSKLKEFWECSLEDCAVNQYLTKIEEEILKKDLSGLESKLKFIELSAEYVFIFGEIDQTHKILGDEIFNMEREQIVEVVNKQFNKIEDLACAVLYRNVAEKKINQISATLL